MGELKPSMQVKLLRVLENGEYFPVGETKAKKADARIISATNQDLPALVRQGKFREDLERQLIQESLHKTVWNRGQAADFLKISRWTLQRKMLKYDLGKKEDQD